MLIKPELTLSPPSSGCRKNVVFDGKGKDMVGASFGVIDNEVREVLLYLSPTLF